MLGGWRVGLGWRALAWAWVCEVLLRCVGVPCTFRWCRGVLSACGVVLPLLSFLPAGPAPSCCSWLCSCCRRLLHSCLGSCLCFSFGRPQSYESALRTAASDEHFCKPFFFFTQSLKQSACRSNSLTKRQRRRSPLDSSLSAIFDEGKVPRNVRAALANLDVWAWRRKGQTKWQSAGADQNAPNKPKQGPPASQRRSQVARSLPRGVPGKRVLLHTCHQDKRSRRQNFQPCRVLTGGRRGVPH